MNWLRTLHAFCAVAATVAVPLAVYLVNGTSNRWPSFSGSWSGSAGGTSSHLFYRERE
ncbi:MAG: hypothetical protein HC829_01235 [Bacteroidales bacterium]|nr:hypothetical protein [Bacteroidales bacterium]